MWPGQEDTAPRCSNDRGTCHRSVFGLDVNHNLLGCALIAVIGILAACGNGTAPEPESPIKGPAPESETPVKAAPSSLEGASCALLPSEIEFGSWEHRSKTQDCLRELAFENWSKARSEAAHIATWGIATSDLDELIATLTRYDSAAAVRTVLEAHGLLNGKGQPGVVEYYGEDWKPLTGSDWLIKAGNQYSFDAETGTHPNNHDILLYDLAELFGDTFEGAIFSETAPHWDSEEPYQLYATLDDRNWQRQAENYGDWYDVSAVLDLVNEMAADMGILDRIMPLETGDQTVTIIVGPGQSLVSAAAEGLIRPADAATSRERGKAFEEEILRRYRISSE